MGPPKRIFLAMLLRTAQESAQILVTAGFSQAAIAERANVKQPTISRILSGEHKDPKGSVVISLNDFVEEIISTDLPP
jgi:transcriptional regulator with XRE-family HTH domain